MIKLGIKSQSFLKFFHDGPKVFMNRLVNSFIKNKSFDIKSTLLPNYDVGLFSVTKGSIYDKPYFLRLDGLYIDKNNTLVDTETENRKILESINSARGLIYQSLYCKKIAESIFQNKIHKKFSIINNGVPLDIFNPNGKNFRDKLEIFKDSKVIITSAHWRRHKRLEETIKLINLLNQSGKQKYKLIVLGKTDLSKSYNENKDIIFAGEIKPNRLAEWYRSADLYVHLAWIEPAGNTQNEAMACGLPVVCCNNGGLRDTVINADGGIVSRADKDYEFDLVDYYNPPEPDYKILMADILKIFQNLNYYKSKINYSKIDINNVAKKYETFIKENFV